MYTESGRETDRERETDKDTENRNMDIGTNMNTATVRHSLIILRMWGQATQWPQFKDSLTVMKHTRPESVVKLQFIHAGEFTPCKHSPYLTMEMMKKVSSTWCEITSFMQQVPLNFHTFSLLWPASSLGSVWFSGKLILFLLLHTHIYSILYSKIHQDGSLGMWPPNSSFHWYHCCGEGRMWN